MRDILRRPVARLGLAVVVVVAAGVLAFYIYGGPGPATTAHGSVSAPALVPAKGQTLFTLDPSGTTASFTIDEVLFGNPNTVVGKTNEVAGQILVDTTDPSKTQVGPIRVDLTALATDNTMRNRTLQSRIFETSNPANQYATFAPAAITGLPASVSPGQTFSFQVAGTLAIHQVTRHETFDVRVTAASDTALTGQAQTTVKYADFGLAIPNVPMVASVGDTVTLALSFTAHT